MVAKYEGKYLDLSVIGDNRILNYFGIFIRQPRKLIVFLKIFLDDYEQERNKKLLEGKMFCKSESLNFSPYFPFVCVFLPFSLYVFLYAHARTCMYQCVLKIYLVLIKKYDKLLWQDVNLLNQDHYSSTLNFLSFVQQGERS